MARKVSVAEVSQHNSPDDTWLVIAGKVYDFTRFAPEHPGGAKIIRSYAGRDATRAYSEVHAPSLIQKELQANEFIGDLDESTITPEWRSLQRHTSEGDHSLTKYQMPHLEDIINLYDLEEVAKTTFSSKAWAYIHGASNDNITRDANQSLLRKIWLRPVVLRNVSTVNTSTKLLGVDISLPIFISPVGAARMAGQEGELALAKGAAATGTIQCISTPASYSLQEILDVTPKHAFFQLYVNKDRRKSEAVLRQIGKSSKIKAIFVTVDVPVISKREADERVKSDVIIDTANVKSQPGGRDKKGAGLTRQNSAFIDATFHWDDLAWLRSETDLPIVVKGVQCWKDARMAMQLGCQGIVVSNHGGRAADTAPPAIVILLELQKNCPEVFGALEVLIDGGFRRGSDVVKAICLGASAVGFGRPMLYAVNYGKDGVQHAIEILRDEIETAMRLCGITDLMRDASPDYVNTCEIDYLVPGKYHPYVRRLSRFMTKL